MNRDSVIFLSTGTIIPSIRSLLRDPDLAQGFREELEDRLPEFDLLTCHHISDFEISSDLEPIIRRYLELAWPPQELVRLLGGLRRDGYPVVIVIPPAIGCIATFRHRIEERLAALRLDIEIRPGFDPSDVPDHALIVTARPDEAEECLRNGRHAIIYVDASRLEREIELRRVAASSPARASYVE